MARRYFTPKLFRFIEDLAGNNDRDWFKANKDRYEIEVKEPALDFIQDFAGPLAKISKQFSADPRPVGGSLFRIQRDTRFGTDKTPYKRHVGIHFRHFATREDVHAPGFYLHLEPGRSFAGVGLWRPATADAYAIRQKIVDRPQAWKRAAHGARFSDRYQLEGDSLTRPPKGFDPDHPLIEDLRRKDFLGTTRVHQRLITSDSFLDDYAALCKSAAPFMRFLCEALELPF